MLQDVLLEENKQLPGCIKYTSYIKFCSEPWNILFLLFLIPATEWPPRCFFSFQIHWSSPKLYTNPGKISFLSSHTFQPLILLFIFISGSKAISWPSFHQIYTFNPATNVFKSVHFSYWFTGDPQGSALGPVLFLNHKIRWYKISWYWITNEIQLSFSSLFSRSQASRKMSGWQLFLDVNPLSETEAWKTEQIDILDMNSPVPDTSVTVSITALVDTCSKTCSDSKCDSISKNWN